MGCSPYLKNGESNYFNNKGYVLISTGENNLYPSYEQDINLRIATIHELGHIISFNILNGNEPTDTTCVELIPKIADLSDLKTNKYKIEAAKEYFQLLEYFKCYLYGINENLIGEKSTKEYEYVFGYSIGFYLSNLYATNPLKFRKYYDYIKKNIFTNDEAIADLFLNDNKFRKMDYLKNDITSYKKLILK